MSVLRVHRHKRDFTITANATPRNQQLSLRARGLLWFLLSQPDGYPVNAAEMAREMAEVRDERAPAVKEGREAVETAVRELVLYGYLRRRREQNRLGQWITYTDVFEVPELVLDADDEAADNGSPVVGPGPADNGSPVVGDHRRSEHKTAGRADNGSADAGSPVAMDQGLSHKDKEGRPPTVVAPDGAHTSEPTSAELVAEPSSTGHAEVIPLRSAPAVQAVATTFDGLKAEIERGGRSWSLTDAAKRAWDQLLDSDANLRAAQEFLVWYIAFNAGRDLRDLARRHWSMAGQKVGRHRALALYGVDQAITRVDIDQPDERGQVGQPFWNYVEAVCRAARAEVAGGGAR